MNPRNPIPVMLVPAAVVAAILGVDFETVRRRTRRGELRWVFNLSAGQGKTLLATGWRFHLAGVRTPQDESVTLQDIVDNVIGSSSPVLRGVEIAQRLCLSRPQLHDLVRQGMLKGWVEQHQLLIHREDLSQFLFERHLR